MNPNTRVYSYKNDSKQNMKIMKKKHEIFNLFLNKLISVKRLVVTILTFFLLSFAGILSGNESGMTNSLAGQQQDKRITGKVTYNTGAALPGVSVVVTGTLVGTLTDTEGKFSFSIPASAQTLSFSFVGMQIQEVTIGTQYNKVN